MPETRSDPITLRPLRSQDDFRACIELQYEIWGEGFGECVPPSLLLATQKVGGVAAGAFDVEGRLLGFVFGISGVRDGRPAHWSDMLAVREEARGAGLGIRLKRYQRERLLELGIEAAYWSYDPLEARNAHINIARLGALPVEYVPDMYGADTGSRLHVGLGTDRFIVEWKLTDPRVEEALAAARREGRGAPEAPLVVGSYAETGELRPASANPPDVSAVRIEIPADIQRTKERAPDAAAAWRAATRDAFLYYMERDYRVTGFLREPAAARCFYLLERS